MAWCREGSVKTEERNGVTECRRNGEAENRRRDVGATSYSRLGREIPKQVKSKK